MRNYLIFLLWLIVFTCALGLIGYLLGGGVGMLVLLPYIMAFHRMTHSLLKRSRVLPSRSLRLQLAVGCNVVFWLYGLVAGYIGIVLAQKTLKPNLDSAFYMFQAPDIKQILLFIFVFIISLLIGLSYWFLGKPAARMLEQIEQKK